MKEYIAFDVHKHSTLAEREGVNSRQSWQCRIEHQRGAIRSYRADVEPGTPVALEATDNWYWIADEIEPAGYRPAWVHADKAKMMLGGVNKTDQWDVHGLNRQKGRRTAKRCDLTDTLSEKFGPIEPPARKVRTATTCGKSGNWLGPRESRTSLPELSAAVSWA